MTGRWLSLIQDTGGKPKLVSVSDVTGEWSPPPVGYMLHCVNALRPDHLWSGPPYGKLSGGNWMVGEPCCSLAPGHDRPWPRPPFSVQFWPFK